MIKRMRDFFLIAIISVYLFYSPIHTFSNTQHKFYDVHEDLNLSWADEQRLITRLLNNYDTAARPVFNASKSVPITFSLSLIQILDMDERNQILTANVWLEQEWLDERLLWNRNNYNYLDKLRVPCDRIWLPDVVLYNSADDYNKGFMQSKVMIKPNGLVFWSLPIKLRSSCKIDVTYFPFDDQMCVWKFGSWTYSGLQVDLISSKESGELTNYVVSGEWHLRSITAKRNVQYYPCCPDEPYPDIIFQITLRRRILHFLYNIIIPCIWLSILSLIGFWLPADSGEKISLGITVLLAFSVFMLLIAENIPATSETVPLIVIYLTCVMSLTSISIIITVLVSRIHHPHSYYPAISRGMYRFFTKYIANYVGMSATVKQYEEHTKKNACKTYLTNIDFIKSVKHNNKLKQPVNLGCSTSKINNTNNHFSILNHTHTTRMNHYLHNIKKINTDEKCMKRAIGKSTTDNIKIIETEWKLIGLIVDRLFFWLISFCCIVSTVVLLLILPVLKHKDLLE